MSESENISVALVSLGCPKNLVDSERMLGLLARQGCIVGATMETADVIVINTCGFLASARDESLGVIDEALACKTAGRARRVVVAGCLPSRDGESLLDIRPDIDAVIGVNDIHDIRRAVIGDDEGAFVQISGTARPYRDQPDSAGRFLLTPPHTAYLRISEGCSQGCAFCTIPAIRGPLRSKPPEMVLAEATELIQAGAVELSIIAQDTTSYGRDLGGVNLAGLLRKLDALKGAEWLRLMYTYPKNFDEDLIDTIAQARRIVPYIDMPLQHISTRILQRMRRGVTGRASRELLGKLRRRIDGLIIRTSFITGLPGETEEDFAELMEFVEDFQFDALGVFEFSPEPGTAAADMPNQVPAELARQRAETLMQTQRDIVASANDEFVKTSQPLVVLGDGLDPRGRCVGRYYGQAPDIDGQCILTAPVQAGQFVSTTVVGYDEYDLIVQA
jgi:ribosomal protein S12 methylthiotransferase